MLYCFLKPILAYSTASPVHLTAYYRADSENVAVEYQLVEVAVSRIQLGAGVPFEPVPHFVVYGKYVLWLLLISIRCRPEVILIKIPGYDP